MAPIHDRNTNDSATPRESQAGRGAPASRESTGREADGGRTTPSSRGGRKAKEALDEKLDEGLEESFPASDPPSVTQKPR